MSSPLSATATLLLALTACSGSSPPSGETAPDRTAAAKPSQSTPATAPEPAKSPTLPAGTRVRGWPSTNRNQPGVYSWDGKQCVRSCVMGFIHNGFATGNVTLNIDRVDSTPDAGDAWTPATVAGHDGLHRQFGARQQEWRADIEGTSIRVRLSAKPRAKQAELDEANGVLASMLTQDRPTKLGFRLVFTLTTDDWDSG
jgi:hypothetical protein